MPKVNKLTSFQETVKVLLDGASTDAINCMFQSETSNGEIPVYYESSKEFNIDLDNLGITIEHLENHGGEGEGDQYWSVYKFSNSSNESCYVKFDGWYQSYNGSEFTEWFFVEPEEKVITVYKKIS